MTSIASDPFASCRARIASSTTHEIVTMVHARLGAKDARARFEAARHELSHDELVDLATRTLEGAG
jgi:hypothetical protein